MTETLNNLLDLNDFDSIVKIVENLEKYDRPFHGKLQCPYCDRLSKFAVSKTVDSKKNSTGLVSKAPSPVSPVGSRTPAVKSQVLSVSTTEVDYSNLIGSVYQLSCTTCNEGKGHLFVHMVADRMSSLIFFKKSSSIATKNTPDTVKYFLDQAASCNRVKAYSATYAMYRTALDALLLDQGLEGRMCGNKIEDLVKKIAAKSAPEWAYNIKVDFLQVIKDLGNSSLHVSKDGAEEEKKIADADISLVEKAFSKLLYEVYERKLEEASELEELKRLEKSKK